MAIDLFGAYLNYQQTFTLFRSGIAFYKDCNLSNKSAIIILMMVRLHPGEDK